MIEFKNVRKVYKKGAAVLDNFNLTINDGEFVFIVGASGAGKTTMMKLLLGEERASSGSILVNGCDLRKLPRYRIPKYRRKLGVVFQDFRLFDEMTVKENVEFAMRIVGIPRAEREDRVPRILRLLGIESKALRHPEELSGGEKQRVAIARAMANNPDILIADEPTGNIDPKMSAEIMEMLLQLNLTKHITVIVVTHEIGMVRKYRSRTIMLDGGKALEIYSGKQGEPFRIPAALTPDSQYISDFCEDPHEEIPFVEVPAPEERPTQKETVPARPRAARRTVGRPGNGGTQQ